MSRPRALLLNPPAPRAVFRDHYCSSEAKSAYLWHPLDLQIQATCLESAGYDVSAWDAVAAAAGPEELTARLDRDGTPDLAVLLVSERTWVSDRATLETLRQRGVRTIAASGDFLRFGTGPLDDAAPLVDFVITDFTTTHLADSVAAGSPTGGGIATVEDVRAHRFRDLGREPLAYPTPNPTLFAPARYRLPYPGFTRFASVLTGYGCPYHCLYCHVGELGYRLRPVDAILDELRRSRAAGCGQVYFRDATINARRKHTLAWTSRMVSESLVMPWAAFATARPFDDELAASMAASGCQHLQIGVETLVDDLRDDNGKPFDGPAHRDFVQTAHRHGIEVTAHLVLGLPGETLETLDATARGLGSADFDYVAVNLAENRPGLPWQQQGVTLAVNPSDSGPVGPGPAGTEAMDVATLVRYRDAAYRRFYLRPERLLKEIRARIRTRDFADGLGLARDVGRWVRAAFP